MKKKLLLIIFIAMFIPLLVNAEENKFEKAFDTETIKYGKTNYVAMGKMDNIGIKNTTLTINLTHENEVDDNKCQSDYCLFIKQYNKKGNIINELYLQNVSNIISANVIDDYLYILYVDCNSNEVNACTYSSNGKKYILAKYDSDLKLKKSIKINDYQAVRGAFELYYSAHTTTPAVFDHVSNIPYIDNPLDTINYEETKWYNEHLYEYFDFYQLHEENNKIVIYTEYDDLVIDKTLDNVTVRPNSWYDKYGDGSDYSFNLSDKNKILTTGTIDKGNDEYIAFLKENEKEIYRTEDYYTFLFPIKSQDYYIVLALADKLESDILIIKDGKVIQTISGNYWNLRKIENGFTAVNLGIGAPYYFGNVSGSQNIHSEVFYQKYNITTKTKGNGTVEVLNSAFGGDTIQFKASAKKGIKLSSLIITTDSGERVEFKEEDIIVDSSGLYSISVNKFTMPYENVTIEAKWATNIINPKTGTIVYSIVIILFIIISFVSYIVLRKRKYHNNLL